MKTAKPLRKSVIKTLKLSGQTCTRCTFSVPHPPSVNAAYRNVTGVGRVKTTAYRKWTAQALVDLARQRVRRLVPGRVAISYFIGRERKGDLLNYEKLVTDFLVANFVIEDDSLVERMFLEWSDNPGVTVHVEAVL